jgi:predicted membrane protein
MSQFWYVILGVVLFPILVWLLYFYVIKKYIKKKEEKQKEIETKIDNLKSKYLGKDFYFNTKSHKFLDLERKPFLFEEKVEINFWCLCASL